MHQTLPVIATASTQSLVASEVADNALVVAQHLFQSSDFDHTFCKVTSTASIGHALKHPLPRGKGTNLQDTIKDLEQRQLQYIDVMHANHALHSCRIMPW